jgi:predicted PurR-regulated permease PerM
MSLRSLGPERRTPATWRQDRPPRWTARAALTVAVVWLAVAVAWGIIGQLHDLLVVVLASLFLAFAIEPGVNWFARRGWKRGAATGVIYLIMLVLLLALIGSVGALVVDQVARLASSLPDLVTSLSNFLQEHFHVNLSEQLTKLTANAGTIGAAVASNALSIGQTILGSVFDLLTVALFTFYLAAQGPEFRRSVCSVLPAARQHTVLEVWELAIAKTAGYLYSRVLLGSVSAVAHAIAFWIIGVPYAVTLGLFVGVVGQFIPTIGTYIGAALPALVALSVSPLKALLVILFAVLYQQVESYLFTPPLARRTMEIHPALAFFSVIAGVKLIGPVGALLALPIAATIQATISSYVTRHDLVGHDLLVDPVSRRKESEAEDEDAGEPGPDERGDDERGDVGGDDGDTPASTDRPVRG